MVTATKKVNGETVKHQFADNVWANLPKDKDGWEVVIEKPTAVAKAEAEAKAKAEAEAK
jgi:hypothetical protein